MNILKIMSCENERGCDVPAIDVDSRYAKVLRIFAFLFIGIMLVAQVLLVIFFEGEQTSDASVYYGLARKAVENNTWYPSPENINSKYIFGNGFVNFLALVLRFTDNIKIFFVFNIFFVQLLMWSCVYIIRRCAHNICADYWFIILFCGLNTFWSEVVTLRTEIPFTAIAFFSLALICSGKRYNYIFSGILMALANWTRPLGIALIIAAIFIYLYRNEKIRYIFATVSSYLVTVILIGTLTFSNCGYFIYQASTFGYNLIMSAHDEADGSYMSVHGEGQVGYISEEQQKDMTFKDFDEYYTRISLQWIMENPFKYIGQLPRKLFYLYATETYSGSSYFNNEINTGGIEYIKNVFSKLTGHSDDALQMGDFLVCFNQVWYMMLMLLFFVGLIYELRKKRWRFMLPYLLFVAAGTGITLLVVGGARYHFPYLPVFMMYAAFFVQNISLKTSPRLFQDT